MSSLRIGRKKNPFKAAWKRLMIGLRLHRSAEQKSAQRLNTTPGALPQFVWADRQKAPPFDRKAVPILWRCLGEKDVENPSRGPKALAHDIFEAANFSENVRRATCVIDPISGALATASTGEETSAPQPGDHVFFTGLLQRPGTPNLFHTLAAEGVSFSVYIDDIVPVERPEKVEQRQAHAFEEGLVAAVNAANLLFVPTQQVKDQLLRWALLAGVDIRGGIVVTPLEAPATAAVMTDRALASLEAPVATVAYGRQIAAFPGAAAVVISQALARAARWSDDERPEISLLVINWNAAALTLECIRQTWAQTEGRSYEIIIVDNGGAELDLERLRRKTAPGVRLIEIGCNRFFGEANNIAAEAARGKYVCLLNNDAFVQPGWLTPLVEKLEGDPSIGAAGPLFLNPDGSVQEAGCVFDRKGDPVRLGRGDPSPKATVLQERNVDYISAALLLMARQTYLDVLGFDHRYEPAYYEDADLCFKLRALGKSIAYQPQSRVIHIEGFAAMGDAAAEARRKLFLDCNHAQFRTRWGAWLKSRDAADLQAVTRQFLPFSGPPQPPDRASPRAVLYTPYPLTPGGGERWLLSLAVALSASCRVTLACAFPYSHMRLRQIGCELGLDLGRIEIESWVDLAKGPRPEIFVAMGEGATPPIEAMGGVNFFLCLEPGAAAPMTAPDKLSGYQAIIVASQAAREHLLDALKTEQAEKLPIAILTTPVSPFAGDASCKKNMILSVGRFSGDKGKGQDFLVAAFKKLLGRFKGPVELHLAGTTVPSAEDFAFLGRLAQSAEGYPVHFHLNATPELLSRLYRDSALFWHCDGFVPGAPTISVFSSRFSVAMAEAMSAECIPLAFHSAGAAELVSHGENGLLFTTEDELVRLTIDMLRGESLDARTGMGRAAGRSARSFAKVDFDAQARQLLTS